MQKNKIPLVGKKRRAWDSDTLCPKAGRILMYNSAYEPMAIPTTCKSWGCPVCGPRKVFTWSKKLTSVLQGLNNLSLITFTLKKEGNVLQDADYVRKAQASFLRHLKRRYKMKMAWIMVPELTKAMVPHLHAVFSMERPIEWMRCQSLTWNLYNEGWLTKSCECLHHVACRLWFEITGDSFIVDVRPIQRTPHGVSLYLAKYLMKGGFGEQRQILNAIGFNRRWSRSRDFPMPDIKLRGSSDDEMRSFEFMGRHVLNDYMSDLVQKSQGRKELEIVSSPAFMALTAKAKTKRKLGKITKLMGAMEI